ncbi:DNA-binding response regulator [Fictibacillus macauensis ZFHKF-1]|uniref:DNA-binding response regulator n=1 Tax=Fictibacillus macauensis ZFHKF-1 TaxID=1196324 RepID=I8AGL0_9BACL|nr:response regulator transcription factor [Fictibacillus macauensis]EIT84817.1 DNA-binding response regulator [Fictibacillus macauensis ZFHKF-1]
MKVLVIDDEESISHLIQLQLELEGYEVSTAMNGKQALQEVKKQPDAVILDLMLPDMSGYELLPKLRAENPDLPVLMLTAKNQTNDKIIGLQLGADDYMTKPFNSTELLLRIRNLLKRSSAELTMKSSDTLEAGGIRIVLHERKVWVNDEEVMMTFREFDLLCLLLKYPSRVFTRDELLEAVWGFEFIGHTRAVDIMIQRLRKKLGTYSQGIVSIYGVGYKWEESNVK